jgi:hypothetical protein
MSHTLYFNLEEYHKIFKSFGISRLLIGNTQKKFCDCISVERIELDITDLLRS